MKSVAVMSQKGGVGKSTIVDELAWWWESQGELVSVYDADGQGGLVHWTGRCIGATHEVVDMPGRITGQESKIAREADLVVVPMLNSPRDAGPVQETLDMIVKSGTKARIVLVVNQIVRSSRRDRSLRDEAWSGIIDRLKLNGELGKRIDATVMIPSAVAFRDAAEAKKSVVALDRRSRAAQAVRTLGLACDVILDGYRGKMAREEWNRRAEGLDRTGVVFNPS